ncbi:MULTISPECIES: hypothetical protein [Planktothricoides]|uniref:Uncharacterized protein n=1 Tax=Planktothricoides raciborskii GIHE-MW2 TaxID=2792601 RepID=A0AAU8JI87_9CYAN|nr:MULTISPECIES: hypothetical protein [Planktothricoides]
MPKKVSFQEETRFLGSAVGKNQVGANGHSPLLETGFLGSASP